MLRLPVLLLRPLGDLGHSPLSAACWSLAFRGHSGLQLGVSSGVLGDGLSDLSGDERATAARLLGGLTNGVAE
jgi:hypothetical protein